MRLRVPLTFRLMLTIRCLFQVCISDGACLLMYFSYAHSCTRVSLLWVVYAGKSRRGKLFHWVERASFTKIRRLLQISEGPYPYNVPIISRPLPLEIVEGEHFVTADLLSSIPGISSPAKEAESEVAGWELVISTQPAQPSFASEDSDLAP